jgi:glycosyltransferase involved in cell wall biosynthesis
MREIIRVAMLGPYPMDNSRISGGVQAAYAYLLSGLCENDQLDIHIITFRPGAYDGPDEFEQNNLTVHLLPLYPRLERLRNYQTYQSTINKMLFKIQPDLIHAQEAGSNALVALRSGFPTVITVHGIQWAGGKYYSSIIKRLHHYFDSQVTEQYVIRHTRHMIAISHYITSYFKDIMRVDANVSYVPNAIDKRFFGLVKNPHEKVILFAGRVLPLKRVMDLVQSFACVLQQVPSARLRIAGELNTEPDYVRSIRQWVQQSHIGDYVDFLGHLSEGEILREFAGCSLLALPSAQETAPMVIAQAMATRTPVVATRVGGIGEMVGEDSSRGFLVNVGDVDGLSKAMIRLLQDPDLQTRMGQSAWEFAKENHYPESVARRIYDVYRGIMLKEQAALV